MDYIIEDPKKGITATIDYSEILRHATTMTSGATLPLQTKFVDWEELELLPGIRPMPRFIPQGIVLTKPGRTTFLLEKVWKDTDDNEQSDGDIAEYQEIDADHWLVQRLKQAEVKRKYPSWHGYHHGNKDYL